MQSNQLLTPQFLKSTSPLRWHKQGPPPLYPQRHRPEDAPTIIRNCRCNKNKLLIKTTTAQGRVDTYASLVLAPTQVQRRVQLSSQEHPLMLVPKSPKSDRYHCSSQIVNKACLSRVRRCQSKAPEVRMPVILALNKHSICVACRSQCSIGIDRPQLFEPRKEVEIGKRATKKRKVRKTKD